MLSQDLQGKIEKALRSVEWGSVEIIIQKNRVTQISVRNIDKTDLELHTAQAKKSVHTITASQKKKTRPTNSLAIGFES